MFILGGGKCSGEDDPDFWECRDREEGCFTRVVHVGFVAKGIFEEMREGQEKWPTKTSGASCFPGKGSMLCKCIREEGCLCVLERMKRPGRLNRVIEIRSEVLPDPLGFENV